MNARFRSGFIQVLHRIPGFRRCFCLKRLRGTTHNKHNNNGESVIGATGLALTGETNFHKNHPICKPNFHTKPPHCNNTSKNHVDEDEEFDEEDYGNHSTELSRMQSRCPIKNLVSVFI